jgi:hypothetical protein
MKKLFIIASCIGLTFLSYSQDDSISYEWKEKTTYSIAENEVWSVDGLENFYVSRKGLIEKYDSIGLLKFSQSIKSLGRMSQMIPVNTMKLMHFSEEQQTLCYFDNTLSSLDDCIDLAEEGIVNATLVSASNQPNKIWVLDNLNSRLLLLSLNNLNQPQELDNIRGVLAIDQISQIAERNNRLFLLDQVKGVYIFDLYGSLLEFIPQESIQQLDANEHTLFTLEETTLQIRAFATGETFSVKLPLEGVYEFIYRNRCFFFRTDSGVHKYELQFSE